MRISEIEATGFRPYGISRTEDEIAQSVNLYPIFSYVRVSAFFNIGLLSHNSYGRITFIDFHHMLIL